MGPDPRLCSDPSCDQRKTAEIFFYMKGGCTVYVYCDILLLISKEKILEPPNFFGLATPLIEIWHYMRSLLWWIMFMARMLQQISSL